MNTYFKYLPNVFIAKCDSEHQRGDTVTLTTKYGKEHECIIFNLIFKRDDNYFYSIVRADGFNYQEWVKRRKERHLKGVETAEQKSQQYYERSNKDRGFLSLGEPIKVGHHSEKRHRNAIESSWNNMGKSVEMDKVAQDRQSKAQYWEAKEQDINLSMPESIDYFEGLLKSAIERHKGMKDGTIKREHSFSLTYANKEVNELSEKVIHAKILWE